jgi:hypothetical protein
MKLMGMSKLRALSLDGADGVPGAVAALCAELTAAVWSTPENVVESYPTALVEGNRVQIAVCSEYAVELIVNYQTGMVLVEFAGRKVMTFPSRTFKTRKTA